jgi:murein DD-endopeptidase MepM/ murein hydrolase activator NlpD
VLGIIKIGTGDCFGWVGVEGLYMKQDDRPDTWRARLRRWFPERQIHLRTDGRVSYYRVSTAFQCTVSIIVLGLLGWGGFSTWSFVEHGKVVQSKNKHITNARLAYHSLLGEVADYQNKFTAITEDLENNHALMLGLVEKNASLQQSLKSVSKKLVVTESERETVRRARESLKGQLAEIENRLSNTANRAFSLEGNLNSVESDLQVALAERNQALFEGSGMRREINKLQTRLNTLEQNEEDSVDRLISQTASSIESVERIIQTAGLKVNDVLKASGVTPVGQGGPFIPAVKDDRPGKKLKSKLSNLDVLLGRWNSLRGVMKHLPLIAPMDTYYITSHFGKRRDPLNKRWSAHYGLDFGGKFKSRVLAPAPGKVTFAGWKTKYGRLIEIDHGAGIKTRYAHLNKIFVKRGQQVKFRDKIGLLGNSGRSTGAHLHYEMVFNGKLKNPLKFIKAGRYVFQEE